MDRDVCENCWIRSIKKYPVPEWCAACYNVQQEKKKREAAEAADPVAKLRKQWIQDSKEKDARIYSLEEECKTLRQLVYRFRDEMKEMHQAQEERYKALFEFAPDGQGAAVARSEFETHK